jgi:hypothetical protein
VLLDDAGYRERMRPAYARTARINFILALARAARSVDREQPLLRILRYSGAYLPVGRIRSTSSDIAFVDVSRNFRSCRLPRTVTCVAERHRLLSPRPCSSSLPSSISWRRRIHFANPLWHEPLVSSRERTTSVTRADASQAGPPPQDRALLIDFLHPRHTQGRHVPHRGPAGRNGRLSDAPSAPSRTDRGPS